MQLFFLLLLVLLLVPLLILDAKRPHSIPHRSSRSRSLCCWALLYSLPLFELFSFSTSNMRRISKWLYYTLRVSLVIFLIELVSHFGELALELSEPPTIVLIVLLPLLLTPTSLPYSIFNHCRAREQDYKGSASLFDKQPFNCRTFLLLFSFSVVCIVCALAAIFLYGSDNSSQKLIALVIIIALSFISALIKTSFAVIATRSKSKCCRCFFADILSSALEEDLKS